VSRKQHRTNGENRYLLYHLRIYFTIRGDSIINTNRKRKKIYRTYVNDVVVENGDKREKWSIIEVDGVKKIQFIGLNTLTNNSWMIICDLILKED